MFLSCGDGFTDRPTEECDAGSPDNSSTCVEGCRLARCGDGFTLAGAELCDDGNLLSGDGCRSDCGKVELCGDTLPDAGEDCDDGNANENDGCDACRATHWPVAVLAVAGPSGGDPQRISITPDRLALDLQGNLFVSDKARVLRIAAADGQVLAVAGTGEPGFFGDGGAATLATLDGPSGLVVDGSGNLFISDANQDRVRRVDNLKGAITTYAGGGSMLRRALSPRYKAC